jgi:hypothetical protein
MCARPAWLHLIVDDRLQLILDTPQTYVRHVGRAWIWLARDDSQRQPRDTSCLWHSAMPQPTPEAVTPTIEIVSRVLGAFT